MQQWNRESDTHINENNDLSMRSDHTPPKNAQMQVNGKAASPLHLVATFSHDMATPLAMLGAAVYQLRQSTSVDATRILQSVEPALSKLRLISDEANAAAKGSMLPPQKLSIHKMVLSAIAARSTLAQKSLFDVTVVDDFDVMVPESPLWRAIDTLLRNAESAIEEAGPTKVHQISVEISQQDQATGLLKISDTGIGMDDFTLNKMWGFGFTKTKGGTGIGMCVVQSVFVDMMHGSINVESKPNEGTTFSFLLPIA